MELGNKSLLEQKEFSKQILKEIISMGSTYLCSVHMCICHSSSPSRTFKLADSF